MASMSNILDRPASEIKAPPPIPVGTYLCVVKGLPRYDKSRKQTDFIEFTAEIQSPLDDVDKEELAKIEGGIRGKSIKLTYYLTEDAAWRLKKFLEDCGFDMNAEGVSMRNVAEQAAGSSIYVTMRQKPSDNGKTIRSEAASTAAVE